MQNIISVEQCSLEQIEAINLFLTKSQRPIFSKSYIRALQSDEFATEIKSSPEVLYRGKCIPSPHINQKVNDRLIRHAINLNTCTDTFHFTDVLLLDENLSPTSIIRSKIGC